MISAVSNAIIRIKVQKDMGRGWDSIDGEKNSIMRIAI
jgi:hypothetical protein